MAKSVVIVLLNWNNYSDTAQCLDSLRRLIDVNPKIILIDNGSVDGSAERLAKDYPEIAMIRNENNLGFVGGNNIGIAAALKQGAEYILLLNNDTVVEPDFLHLLVQAMASKPKIGLASPRIMLYDQAKRSWFNGGRYYPLIGKPYHLGYGQIYQAVDQSPQLVDWISGCAMLIKSELIVKVGLLDPDYFNNYEDVDYCWRAKRAGYQIVMIPRAVIYHKFAASVGGKHSPFYTYFRVRNNLLFFLKTGQWLPLLLNSLIFPLYTIGQALLRNDLSGARATGVAVRDFLTGRLGIGSAEKMVK